MANIFLAKTSSKVQICDNINKMSKNFLKYVGKRREISAFLP
jgi:hypothetical protein